MLPLKAAAKQVSMHAEVVMQAQKLICGDVKGENMMNHSRAATSKLKTSRLLSSILV